MYVQWFDIVRKLVLEEALSEMSMLAVSCREDHCECELKVRSEDNFQMFRGWERIQTVKEKNFGENKKQRSWG